MKDIFNPQVLEELGGQGDNAKLLQVLQAQSAIIAESEDLLLPEESLIPKAEPMPESQMAEELAVQKSDLKVQYKKNQSRIFH